MWIFEDVWVICVKPSFLHSLDVPINMFTNTLFKRGCNLFNSMWLSHGSNIKFLKFEVICLTSTPFHVHGRNCSSSLSVPFVSTMTSNLLQFRTKSCRSDAKVYGIPFDISKVVSKICFFAVGFQGKPKCCRALKIARQGII